VVLATGIASVTTPATDRDLDALYRAHAPAITASLARVFGAWRLDVIEAGVQEAFLAALQQWPDLNAVPEEPGAWLHAVARRKVVDALRRASWFAPDGGRELDALALEAPPPGEAHGDAALLGMMFVCCHPALPVESAIALALRTLCGFPIPALCRALYTDEAALEKRLARARQTLRDLAVELDARALAPADLEAREHAVLRTLYVLFLEGYCAHAGPTQVDADLCRTAIRLSNLLVTGRPTPRAHALHALLLLQASRLEARTDAAGELISLERQDRLRWDRGLIARGLWHLDAAAAGHALSPFHLEAGIAAAHALAPTYASTPWRTIVELYDRLLALTPSPVIAMQRAIALGRAEGPQAGLRALELAACGGRLDDDPVLPAAIGQLQLGRGDLRAARSAYRRALELAATEPERRFLLDRLATLETEQSR
jgi:RNA polymerase sigma-70 factor (ECF subfamily)